MKFLLGFFVCILSLACQKQTDTSQPRISLITEKWSPSSDFNVWRIRINSSRSPVPQKLEVDWGLNKTFNWMESIIIPANTSELTIDTYVPFTPGDKIDYVTVK